MICVSLFYFRFFDVENHIGKWMHKEKFTIEKIQKEIQCNFAFLLLNEVNEREKIKNNADL